MMEKIASWAIGKVVTEEVDDSVTTAALVGVALDTATFSAMGLPAKGAVAAGAATGIGTHLYKKARKGKSE
jgi:hypothetical protein